MEKVKGLNEFFKVGSGFSSGYGDGSGDGYGYGNGSGDGSDSGYGYGYGDGSDSDSGYGYGSGYGDGISVFNNDDVYKIDQVPTIIKSIKGNVAKGFILNSDFTLDKCFVVKDGNLFAHGKTLRQAMEALNEKKWENLNTDEVIAEFCKYFEKGKSYKGSEFFEWHHYLTGSCLQGRKSFVKNHDLSLDNEFTVDEFIKLTEEDYNGKIIKQLKEVWDKK